jgi:hypothetical protein
MTKLIFAFRNCFAKASKNSAVFCTVCLCVSCDSCSEQFFSINSINKLFSVMETVVVYCDVRTYVSIS